MSYNVFNLTDHLAKQLGAEQVADIVREREDALVAVRKIAALIDFASGVLTPTIFNQELRKFGYNVQADEGAIEQRKN